MMLNTSLIVAPYIILIILVNVLLADKEETKEISSIFESLGYSSVCVASALVSCELSSKENVAEIVSDHESVANRWEFYVERAKNCNDLQTRGDSLSGVRTIYPYDCCRHKEVKVYCDQTTDGGGWTVIQRRDALPLREDFERSWIEYVLGFGNITGEYWLGLNNIHALVSSALMELRIDLEDYEGNKRWAKYGVFYIGDASSKYLMKIDKYSGDAGDAMVGTPSDDDVTNGMMFTTKDQDNDKWTGANCAVKYRGAWWYNFCHHANLNGYPYIGAHTSYADGINYHFFRDYHYSLKSVSMKVRKAFKA